MTSIDSVRQLLLISNSTLYGKGYLDHVENEIRAIARKSTRVLFVPFALLDRRTYTVKARERFKRMGLSLTSVHDASNMPRAVEDAEVLFVGGGNTFRLLRELYDHDLLTTIRRRVAAGMPYIGSS